MVSSKNEKSMKILEDEIALLSDALRSTCRRPVFLDKHNTLRPYVFYARAVVVSDGSRCGLLAAKAYKSKISRKYPKGVVLCDVSQKSKFLRDQVIDNTCVYFFVDSERHRYSKDIFSCLQKAVACAERNKNIRIIFSLVVPEPKGLPPGVKAVAEREYDYILETKKDMAGASRDYTLSLHRFCREAVRDKGVSLTVLRSVNIMGPAATGFFAEEIQLIVDQVFASKKVVVEDADYGRVVNVTLVTDVVAAAFWAVYNAVSGHEFNVVSFNVAISTLKRLIFESFSRELSYMASCSSKCDPEYRCLSDLKFLGTRWRKFQKGRLDLASAVKRTVCYSQGKVFAYAKNTSVYEGKLPAIKSVEMMILREIDRICRKHEIKYFLAGGTLLGAVRNGRSIPWDDDFDIGFLRKDFDMFREVCEKELGGRFVHTCYYNGTDSHYMVDKIRMRDTYFSTRYSSIHAVEDGVFIDCLVYDATYDNKILAKIHDKVCGFLGNLVQAYWREYRRDEVKSRLKWVMIKTMELLPIGFYHRLYSWMISLRKGCENPSCVLDSMGKHIGLGTIPFKGLGDVKRVPFDDGFMAPIPEDPTGYLVYDYGKGYKPLPPYCKQVAPHNFARIDLGKYLYADGCDAIFRNTDVRGELFEKEVEI